MTAHTPGPWKHVRIGTRITREAVWTADHGTVCYVPNAKPLLVREANARLIAAAPELLEALERAVTALSAASIADKSLYAAPVTLAARAAIAKARGESK